jgi:hypothetical protein
MSIIVARSYRVNRLSAKRLVDCSRNARPQQTARPTGLLFASAAAPYSADALNALLRGLLDSLAQSNEGEGTWSPFEIIAHLIHGERTDWLPRIRVVLESSQRRTFELFDRMGHWRESRDRTLEQLLDEFTRVRSANLRELEALNLRSVQLELRGRHPALEIVMLSELLATWATHGLTHLPNLEDARAPVHRGHGIIEEVSLRAVVRWSQ